MINKPIATISSLVNSNSSEASQESVRPHRNPGISQSVIFDSSGGANNYDSKPAFGNTNLSIDQLYSKKHGEHGNNRSPFDSTFSLNSATTTQSYSTNTSNNSNTSSNTGKFNEPSTMSFGNYGNNYASTISNSNDSYSGLNMK